jgi:hypothetical protein
VRARELLAEERATASIERSVDRKAIFMSESEIVFLFEGPESEESLKELFNDPVRSSDIGHWLPLFDGPLHRAPEVYLWEREAASRS